MIGNINLKKFLFLYLIITLVQLAHSNKNNNEESLKFLGESLPKNTLKLNNGLEDFAKKIILDMFLVGDKNNTLINQNKAKPSNETYNFKVTDESLNSILFMAQRANPINLQVRNDSGLNLPIGIDTKSLSLIIPELSEAYPTNTNMTITVYENSSACKRPILDMAIDGVYLDLDLGLKFAVYNSTSLKYDEIIDIVISTEVKTTIYTDKNLLSIFIMKATLSNLKFNNNTLNLKEQSLLQKFNGFFRVLISQTRTMLTNVEILSTLNKLTNLNFSSLDLTVNLHDAELTIK